MKTFNKNHIFTFNNKAVTSNGATSPIKEQHTEKVIYFSKYPSNKVHHPSKNQSHSFLLEDHINNELHSKNINEDYYNKFLEKLVTDEHNEKPTTHKRNSNKKSTQIYQIQRSQSNKNFVNYKSGNRLIVGQLSINKNNNNSHLNFRNNNQQIIQSKNSLKSNNNNLIFISHHSNSTCQNMSSINNRRVNSISLGYPYHPSFTEHKRQHSRYYTPKCSTPFNNKNSRSLRNGCVLSNKATYKLSIGDDIEKEGNIKNSKTIPGNGFFINGNLNKDYKLNYQLPNNNNNTNNNNNKQNCNVFTSSDVDSDKNKKTKIKHKVLEYNNNNSKLQNEINNEDIKEQDILKKKNKHLWCCIPFCSQ